MPHFTLDDLQATFRSLAQHLTAPSDLFLVGGGAMAILDAKTATKDVDLVFRDIADLENVEKSLVALNAHRIEEPSSRAARPGARRLWETPDGMGWDLFLDNVIGLPFFPQDFDTAEVWLEDGDLRLCLLSADLIFIMKAFTPRTRDIGDMYELFRRGLVTNRSVADVIRKRLEQDPLETWLPHFYQGVQDLATEHDIDAHWISEFEDPATDALLANLIVEEIGRGASEVESLTDRLSAGPDETRRILERLEDLGRVKRVQSKWRLVDPHVES